MLTSVGFTAEMQQAPVASLSGGWKMKLAIGACSIQTWTLKPGLLVLCSVSCCVLSQPASAGHASYAKQVMVLSVTRS